MNSMICPYCGKLISYNSFFDAFYCSKCGGFFKQATVMERNDLNEPLTLDDAIAHLDDTLSDTGHKWSCESCRMEHVQLRAWLAELREIKQERNAPLTLDELRQMDGEPVWIHFIGGAVIRNDGWFIVSQIGTSEIFLSGKVSVYKKFWYYGETWLAYRHKPEEGTV